ncbi:MAG TPA: Tex-like N-terminal domain-containing protein, partial [Bacillota bacterium]|nr:Tex-like N-terminal domain-containing protein [Bacillota bacterium]
MELVNVVAQELKIGLRQVENTVRLLDEGNTIPFIARYRKEVTGELDEEQIRDIEDRITYLRNLETRKSEVLGSIEEQGKLTPELAAAINAATKLQEVEDLYRPYKPKKRTRAMIAKERGLEPLAELVWRQQTESGTIDELVAPFINPDLGVTTVADALAGARDIIAEQVSDDPDYRKLIREYLWDNAVIASEAKAVDQEKAKERKTKQKESAEALDEFRMYADYKEPLKKIPPHRILALNRGEKLEALKVTVECDHEIALSRLRDQIVSNRKSLFTSDLEAAIGDGYKRLLFPSLERELRSVLTETAEEHAIKVFGLNLRNLILQAPVRGFRVMGVDPGYRTGCKVAVVDETGKLLDTSTIYPHPPQEHREEALAVLEKLVTKHRVNLVTIGNGTASRESEVLIAELIHRLGGKQTSYCIVSE